MLRLLKFQPLVDRWERGPGCFFADLDQRGAAAEVIIAVAGDIRFNHQISAAAGLGAIHILGNREALPYHVKYMPRSIGVVPVAAQTDREDFISVKELVTKFSTSC